MEIEKRLLRSRIQLLLRRCFYGQIALSLPLKEENRIPTFATDGKFIYYNKEFAESIANDEHLEWILIHEILHNVLLHLLRIGARNPERWKIAVDFATNCILKNEFGYVIEGCLYDVKFENKSAEEIYNLLPDIKKKGGFGRPLRYH